MTKKPLTIGTPEYVAWAKKGEREGELVTKFDALLDELCELVDNKKEDSVLLARGRRKLNQYFVRCECECDCY